MPENYNQLVLAQLQSLSQAIEALRGDLQLVRQEITELKVKKTRLWSFVSGNRRLMKSHHLLS